MCLIHKYKFQVVVLSFLNEIETSSAIGMLGIELACLAVEQLSKKEK